MCLARHEQSFVHWKFVALPSRRLSGYSLPIEEACKYFGATASGSSLDDADVTAAFENNHYWKYRYEFMEDDHLNFLLLLFHLYRCKRFLSEAKDKWKLLGGKPSVRKDPAKRMQRRAYIKTKVSSKPSQ